MRTDLQSLATAVSMLVLTGLTHAAQPSFTSVEAQLNGFIASDSDVLDNQARLGLKGSYAFNPNYFISFSSNQISGGSSLARNTDIGVGRRFAVTDESALYGSLGARRFGGCGQFESCSTSASSTVARATGGIRSQWNERFETDLSLTGFEPDAAQDWEAVLKGTYFFTERVGASMEVGSIDGDSIGSLGLRLNF